MAFDKRWLAALAVHLLGLFLLYEFRSSGISLPSLPAEPELAAPAAKDAGRRLAKVEIIDGKFHRDGQITSGKFPGKIIGIGGNDYAPLAHDLGFEAFRTWGLDQLPWAMLEARKQDFKVMAGLDMTRDPQYYTEGSEHCFDNLDQSSYWQNAIRVILATVNRFKTDPNMLMWLVGNELEIPIDIEKGNDCMWKRVNWVARKVKDADPDHPVGIALAGIASPKVTKMSKLCPEIDVLGTNIYGNEIRDIGSRLRAAGWTKPWAFTECGALGPWEVAQTSWGAPVELSSSRKGQYIYRGKRMCEEDEMCIAFMAFLWGWKWEKTGTWFGLINDWKDSGANSFLNDIGQPVYDTFGPKDKRAFRIHIEGFKVDKDREVSELGFAVDRGAEVQLDLLPVATPFDGDNGAWAHWVVTKESQVDAKSDANYHERPQAVIPNVVEGCPGSFRAKLKTSKLEDGGNYRLYAFARRKHEGGFGHYPSTVEASFAIPFRVGPQMCSDVTHGHCYDEVNRIKTSAQRMGYNTWPAKGLRASSSFKEYQSALHVESHAGCPAPCSVQIPASATADCSVPTKLRYVADVAAIQELLAPPPPFELPDEECHTSIPHEDCYYATKWVMDQGRFTTNNFPELTADSSWEDGQLALWKRARNGCKKPCMESAETTQKADEECHTSVPHEDCFYGTKWLLDEGRWKYPDAFPEVTVESTWEDAQEALWKRSKNGCKKPCRKEPEPTTTTTTTTTTTEEEMSGEPEETTTQQATEEECHTSVEPEDCFYGTKWLMDEGRWQHPDSFPEVTASSTWEDAQEALWKRSKNGCKKPCPHESESETEEEEPETEEECHSSVPPEDCYYATKWLMDEGRWQHPHAFPEVTAHSTWEDAQAALWKRSEGSCKKPCAPEPQTTQEPETTTQKAEEESQEPEKEEEVLEPEEDCYTSVEPEKCFYATKWLMEEGRYKYPDAFSEVTSESSWEDAQEALWKRGKDGCKKPCPHESADDIDKEECHNAVPPDDCYYSTKWLLDEGRWQHPHSFPEVTAHSTFEDAQRALWRRSEGSCKKPCSEESEEQEKEEEKEEEEVPKEDCYTSVEPEKCFYATKWLMEEGRYKHPEAFPEVTPESSWEDAQTAFWKRGKDGCQKPCPHDSETLTDEVEEEDCHNSVPHEDCYYATKWLMDEGRWKHPEAFPEVTAASTWKDAQMALWKRSKDGCQKPCT